MRFVSRSFFVALSVFAVILTAPALAQEEEAPPEADISVTKSGPPQAAAGSDVTYTITIRNAGDVDAADVTLTDPLPAGMTFVSLSQTGGPLFSCTTPAVDDPGTVVCTHALLAVNETASFTLVARIPADAEPGSVFVNIATGTTTTTDNTDENNSGVAGTTTPPPPRADIGVMKHGPVAAAPGANVTYTISVANSGPSAAQNVTLTDTLPGTMTFVSLSQTAGPMFSCTTPAIGAGGTITCSVATLNAGVTATITLTGNIPADTQSGTEFQNTAVAGTDTLDPNEENNVSSTSLIVSAVDLSVTKSGPAAANAGENLTYTIVIANAGPDVASGVTLSDTLPEGTTFVSLTQNNGPVTTCSTGTRPIDCNWEFFAAGASAQFTLVVRAGNTTLAVNTVEVTTSGSFDVDASNDSDSVSTTITPQADLALTKDGPATVTAGTDATFTINVTNLGPSDANSITVTEAIPANTTFVSASPGCSASATTVTCTRASLLAGASASFTIVFRVSPAATGTIDNTATVTSATSDPNGANNDDTASATVSTSADLAVVKSGPASVTAGSNITWTIALTNQGPSDAVNVALDDALPANATFVSFTQDSGPTFTCTAPPVHCTITSFPAAASATFTLVAHVSPAAMGTVDNTAAVTSATADPVSSNNQSTVSTAVNPSADLAVVKSGPAGVTAGANITWTIALTNHGPSTATDVALDDTLPANTTFVSFTQDSGPAFACTSPPVHCTIAAFPPAATATFTLVATVSPAATGSVENTAVATSATMDPVPANNTSTATALIGATADLSVTKSGPASITAGENATYTVTVANAGPSDAHDVTLSDPVPPNATFVSATQTSGPAFTCDATIQCTIASFPAGASATFTIVLRIDPAAFEPVVNAATVTSSTIDPTPGNAGATVATAVVAGPADVRVAKSVSSPAPVTGGTATFTIDVTNDGPGTALNSVVTDVLPAGTTFVSADTTQGSCSGTSTVTCTVGTLAPGQTETITIVVTLPDLPTVVANTATVTTDNTDPNPANNTSTAELTVQPGVAVPALSPLAMVVMAAMLAMIAVFVQRT